MQMPTTGLTGRVTTAYPDATGCTPLSSVDASGRPYNGTIVILDAGITAACAGSVQALNAQRAGVAGALLYIVVNVDYFPTYRIPLLLRCIQFSRSRCFS